MMRKIHWNAAHNGPHYAGVAALAHQKIASPAMFQPGSLQKVQQDGFQSVFCEAVRFGVSQDVIEKLTVEVLVGKTDTFASLPEDDKWDVLRQVSDRAKLARIRLDSKPDDGIVLDYMIETLIPNMAAAIGMPRNTRWEIVVQKAAEARKGTDMESFGNVVAGHLFPPRERAAIV